MEKACTFLASTASATTTHARACGSHAQRSASFSGALSEARNSNVVRSRQQRGKKTAQKASIERARHLDWGVGSGKATLLKPSQ